MFGRTKYENCIPLKKTQQKFTNENCGSQFGTQKDEGKTFAMVPKIRTVRCMFL